MPAYKAGGPIQSIANLVNQFQENISYKIVCSNKDIDGTLLDVEANKWIRYNSITDVFYCDDNKNIFNLKKLRQTLKPDILFINGLYSWMYNLVPLLLISSKRKIISARGMLHPGALSQKKNKKKIYLSLMKMLSSHKKYEFHASNEQEKKFIQNTFGPTTKIHIAYNFPKKIDTQTQPEKISGFLKIISIGLISPMKNYLLVLQSLQSSLNHIEYNIYGAIKDEGYWKQCLKIIDMLPENITVLYHGDISPAKVVMALAQNHIFILPSKSENFGHAIFEALSAGRPVITSDNTPWNNLEQFFAGANVSIEKTDNMLKAINYFATMNKQLIDKWSTGAKTYAQASIDIDKVKEQYKQMFSLAT